MSFRYNWVLLLLLFQFVYWIILYLKKYDYKTNLLNNKTNIGKTLTKKMDFSSIKIKNRLFLISLAVLTLASSGPQIGTRVRPIDREGVDLVIVLDTSISMEAEDVTPSRIGKAKFELNKLISNLNGDRVAIIVFAGSSHMYLPLTTDYEAALLFLNEIETDMIPTQGTSLSSAINTAITAFTETIDKYKVVLLVTDGEDHEGEAIDLASKAVSNGMIINTVAVGSNQGGLIPLKSKISENKKYKRDKKGRLVTSKINPNILKNIGSAGNGSYYRFSNNKNDSYKAILNDLENMEKKTISTHEFSEYEDRFQLFSLLALILFLVSFMYPTIVREG